ncbi:hypothetical protein [Streptomyces nigrescens]|uniref:hypothetical protein n=1 Tax=Streptomyces nigrescens TaxID=1920 RepID=UPI0036F52CD3
MDADDIPTHITTLTYTAPGPKLSQNDAAQVLAHSGPPLNSTSAARSPQKSSPVPGHEIDGDAAWDSGRDREFAAHVARSGVYRPTPSNPGTKTTA